MSRRNSKLNITGLPGLRILAVLATPLVVTIGGCQATDSRAAHSEVSDEISNRFAAGLGDENPAEQTPVPSLPPDVSLEDGITEDESVAVALWNNAALYETLAELGVSKAQLLDAQLISDPQFMTFLPVGPKQFEMTTQQAVDALWLQPIRARAARLDLDRISQSMVQNGLDLIRDARVAHSELVLANEQAGFRHEAVSVRARIAALTLKQLDAGDISEPETMTSRQLALAAEAAEVRATQQLALARQRLRVVMGLTMSSDTLQAVARPEMPAPTRDIDSLLEDALATRPDLRAAEIAIETAGQRIGLARHQFINLDAIYDANGTGLQGFEPGPGPRVSLPLFNRNQGGIAIADARWNQATRQYVTTRDRVALEVRNSHTQLVAAQNDLAIVQEQVLPALTREQELVRLRYQRGGSSYLPVLEIHSRYLDGQIRESQSKAALRRAIAELDRSVGHRVTDD